MKWLKDRKEKMTYVETMFGRRRYYPDLRSFNGQRRQMAERAAINMPIHAAADIIKMAMEISLMRPGLKKFGDDCLLLAGTRRTCISGGGRRGRRTREKE